MRKSIALASVGTAVFAAGVAAQVPEYGEYELQARTNLLVNDNGWNLPPGASFNSITVDMNDAAEVIFKVQVVPGRDGMSVWFGGGGQGELVCHAEDNFDALISDPKINADGAIVYGQFNGDLNGVYSCDATTGEIVRLTAGPIGASSWGTPDINDAGEIGYRAGFGSGNAWVSLQGSSFAYHATEIGIDVDSPYDFLFTPAFDNERRIAGVVRRADGGSSHREIRLFTADGKSLLIAQNAVGDPNSPYNSFDNSVGLNDAGQVAFIASLPGGVRGVFRSDGTTTAQIAREGEDGVVDIEFFAPSINAGGLVAFRGADANGQAIFVGDGTALRRVVGRGDAIATDNGAAQIGQHDTSPVFGGGVAINTRGDIAFTAGLHPVGNNQVEWGTGVIVAPAVPTDVIFVNGFDS